MRLSLASDLRINQFNNGAITEKDSGMFNAIVDMRGDVAYITQRPSVDIVEDASTKVSVSRGRGIFYRESTSSIYGVNDGNVFKAVNSNIIGNISTGVKVCKMVILDEKIIILDKENNQGWILNEADTLTQITDTDFPSNKTPAKTLSYGGAVLDGYLFVMDVDGNIYNSANGDPSTWAAIDVVVAEREPDSGVYLGKHHDHIVAYGVRTIEFFYNAANAVASPLTRRQDIAYTIGCHSGESVWESGDAHFFVGVDSPGSIHVYMMSRFTPQIISNPTIDSFLTQSIVKDNFLVFGSGISAHGRLLYLLTVYKTSTDIVPYITLCYDAKTNIWSEWETTIGDGVKFPVVDWSIRSGSQPRYGEGIMSNGDIFTLNDNMVPDDSIADYEILEPNIVQSNIVERRAGETVGITATTRTGMWDGGSNSRKFCTNLRFVGDLLEDPGGEGNTSIRIRWSNEDSRNFGAWHTINPTIYQKITRLGRFRRRNYEVEIAGNSVARLEALEMSLQLGGH